MQEALREGEGILRVGDLRGIVSRPTIAAFVREHGLVHVARGVYAAPNAWVDEFAILAGRSRRITFSHLSALELHDYLDQESALFHVTVPSGYNATSLLSGKTRVFYIKSDLYELGREEVNSPYGAVVPTYNIERTLCDMFRSRAHFESDKIASALKRYMNSSQRNIIRLSEYAQKLGVERVMKPIIEALI